MSAYMVSASQSHSETVQYGGGLVVRWSPESSGCTWVASSAVAAGMTGANPAGNVVTHPAVSLGGAGTQDCGGLSEAQALPGSWQSRLSLGLGQEVVGAGGVRASAIGVVFGRVIPGVAVSVETGVAVPVLPPSMLHPDRLRTPVSPMSTSRRVPKCRRPRRRIHSMPDAPTSLTWPA